MFNMKELAFTVKHDSEFYKQYFHMKEAKQHFHELALDFFEKRGISKNGKYCIYPVLHMELSDDEYEKYRSQIMKERDKNGLYIFKKKSKMQQEWAAEVVNKSDMEAIDSISSWYWGCIGNCGRYAYALWSNGEEIYGYLESKNNDLKVPEYAQQIKMSEYYAVIESLEE